ncbi:unnamed protein product, partial [Didymodactylos carnosus]
MKNVYDDRRMLIRTRESHDIQVQHIRKCPQDHAMYGVKGTSVISVLPSFHPITSLPPDLMHDILEGVMPKLTASLLKNIVSVRLLSNAALRQRINSF